MPEILQTLFFRTRCISGHLESVLDKAWWLSGLSCNLCYTTQCAMCGTSRSKFNGPQYPLRKCLPHTGLQITHKIKWTVSYSQGRCLPRSSQTLTHNFLSNAPDTNHPKNKQTNKTKQHKNKILPKYFIPLIKNNHGVTFITSGHWTTYTSYMLQYSPLDLCVQCSSGGSNPHSPRSAAYSCCNR